MAPPSPSPSWVILGQVARVTADDADLPPGAEFSIDPVVAPPGVTLLTIPPRLFPDTMTPNNYPSVVAADPSGLLLLRANQGSARGPTVIDTPGRQQFGWRPYVPGYFLLDAADSAKPALPLPKPEYIMHPGHLGLIAAPGGGGHYMIAELQPFLCSSHAILLSFSSQVGEWVNKDVVCPVSSRQLAPNGVVSHSGRLWWVDLSCCLLTCDPFADAPVLRVVPLPPGKKLPPGEGWGVLDKYRCVRVSGGKLRFVDMYMNQNSRGAAQISVWTLPDPDSTEWTLEYEATFKKICYDESYKATGLPKRIPVLALIHPTNPNVVYFFLNEHLFGVDVPARKVVECEVYKLVGPPSEHIATRFVHAWQLPEAPCQGSAQETDNGVREELQQLHAQETDTGVSEELQQLHAQETDNGVSEELQQLHAQKTDNGVSEELQQLHAQEIDNGVNEELNMRNGDHGLLLNSW